ncbi:hypothetical protein IPZ58_07420 [Streptomyces roseoverticillatus]|uniref:hypothetical protein n=1 Tax=Streptomyces roseoverticillatus TaxID=66429 RepID=UPI001F35F765|nr:hypothetical protein [Streptomyces roseoverticillatus]MCF3101408.1 hypothetical protein [Streptomyces roseoverticillatus]
MSIAAVNAARSWISESDPDSHHADLWLRNARIVVLPVGHKWCAVKVPSGPGTAAVRAGLNGPAILEPRRFVYFPVPLGTDESWLVPGTDCLGEGNFLGVPGPTFTCGPGVYWLTRPTGSPSGSLSGALVDPDELRAALASPCL